MLKDEYLDAKIGVDTAENEPEQASGWLFLQSRVEPATDLRAALAATPHMIDELHRNPEIYDAIAWRPPEEAEVDEEPCKTR